LDFAKLNFDESMVNSSAIEGFIIRSWIGRLVKAGAAYYDTTSITMVEVKVLHSGLQLAIQKGFNDIVIKGDNKVLIQALKGKIQIPWKLSNRIEDIHIWQKQGIQLHINHLFREANMAVD